MKKLLTTTFLSLLTFSTLASNANIELNIAQDLLNKNQAKNGYEFLLAGFDKSSKNPLEYRLLGILAKANGKLFTAKDYFNLAIKHSDNPALTGEMKLELAQVEYQLGNGEVAKSYLTQVKASKPPAKVGDNIDAFLNIITTKGTPKKYQLSASMGYIHDSNANAGPTVDSVLLFDLPFTLSNNAKETSDNANQLSLGFNHNTGLTDDMSVQNSFSLNRTDYNDLDNLDSVVFSGSTGLSFKVSDEVITSIPLVANWVKIGHDNSYYSYSYGLAPQLRYQLDKKLSLDLGTTLSRKKYQSSSDRDSENYSISPSLAYQINPKSYAVFGLTAGKTHSGLDYYSHDTKSINARYSYAFQNGLQTSISASYTDSKYDGKEAAYTETRHGKTSSIGLSASYGIKAIVSNLVFSINHTSNDSNLPIYEYDRNQVFLSLKKTF